MPTQKSHVPTGVGVGTETKGTSYRHVHTKQGNDKGMPGEESRGEGGLFPR